MQIRVLSQETKEIQDEIMTMGNLVQDRSGRLTLNDWGSDQSSDTGRKR